MDRSANLFEPLMWLVALLLAAFVVGCVVVLERVITVQYRHKRALASRSRRGTRVPFGVHPWSSIWTTRHSRIGWRNGSG